MSTSSYHHGRLRDSLVEAGRDALRTVPAERISLREAARALGVSHAAPYKHFPERADFVLALAVACQREFVAAQRTAVADAGADASARLSAMGIAYVQYALANPHAFALIFDPEVSPPGTPPAELAPLVAEHNALLRGLVRDGAAAGLYADVEPDVLAAALWSQVHGLATLVISGRLPPEVAAPVVTSMLREGA